jgi:hypothetical protein
MRKPQTLADVRRFYIEAFMKSDRDTMRIYELCIPSEELVYAFELLSFEPPYLGVFINKDYRRPYSCMSWDERTVLDANWMCTEDPRKLPCWSSVSEQYCFLFDSTFDCGADYGDRLVQLQHYFKRVP